MSTISIKKILLAGTALVAVSILSTQTAHAATETLAGNAEWGVNGNGVADAGTGSVTPDAVQLSGGTDVLTITNDQVANDGSANKDTFSIGNIDDSAATADTINITQDAAGTVNPLSVTVV